MKARAACSDIRILTDFDGIHGWYTEPWTLHLEPFTWNPELGTFNSDSGPAGEFRDPGPLPGTHRRNPMTEQ